MKEIEITQGKKVIVDDEWYPILIKKKWHYQSGYACTDVGGRLSRRRVYMHRYITMAPDDLVVDHINRNKLDNRTENLRIVYPIHNYWNRTMLKNNKTGYKGVSFDKTRGKYAANICKNRKQYNLGRFDTKEEAAIAYNKAAKELYGEYAFVNEVLPSIQGDSRY